MTNEELAAAIKQGEEGLIFTLWEQVENLGRWLSQRYSNMLVQNGFAMNHTEAFEDLFFGCCYPSMCKALKRFNPEHAGPGSFAALFRYCFMEEAQGYFGFRSSKRDPLIFAESLNEPIPGLDGKELSDLIPDPHDPYEDPERKIYLEQLHRAMCKALDTLDSSLSDIIRKHYFEGFTDQQIADSLSVSKQNISKLKRKGIREIRRGKHARALRSFLNPEFDYRAAGLSGTGVHAFQQRGSSTERAAIEALEEKEKAKYKRRRSFDRNTPEEIPAGSA